MYCLMTICKRCIGIGGISLCTTAIETIEDHPSGISSVASSKRMAFGFKECIEMMTHGRAEKACLSNVTGRHMASIL